jgi:phosphoglycolate phosphatase-like HAD superfamily hydrolase
VTGGGALATPANWHWRDGPLEPGRAVVFDIDGVLSDAGTRQHYLEGSRRDWDGFFDACGDDPLIDDVAALLGLLDPGLQVVLLTGRPLRVQPQTVAWLKRYELRWDVLIMRDYGDYSRAREFKKWTVDDLRRYGFDLVLGFEDDRRNLEMFRAEGVPCVYIHSGYYD